MSIDPQTLNPTRISLTLEQRALLQEKAAREGSSVSELVRRAVNALLAQAQEKNHEQRA